MNKRKSDEMETTCNTWLTTRNKKQDLKEYESTLQRLSQQRLRMHNLTKMQPVGNVTNITKQTKLSDFFQNINPGKENNCNQNCAITVHKNYKMITDQVTTIDELWTNRFHGQSSYGNTCTNRIEDTSTKDTVEGDLVVNSNADNLQDKSNYYTSRTNSNSDDISLLNNELQSHNTECEDSTYSPYLDYSDDFCRQTSNQNSCDVYLHTLEEVEGTGHSSTSTHSEIKFNEHDVKSDVGIISQDGKLDFEKSEPSMFESEPSMVEVLPIDEFSLKSLRFTIDSEEHVLKLRDSCLQNSINNLQKEEMSTDKNKTSKTNYLKSDANQKHEFKIKNEIYFEDCQIPNENFTTKSEFFMSESQNDNDDLALNVDEFSSFSESLELVEDSQGCIKVEKTSKRDGTPF